MMRILLLLLIGANLVLLLLWQVGASDWFAERREPWRVTHQIAPDAIRILPPETAQGGADVTAPDKDRGAESASAKSATCMEFGGFAGADVNRVAGLIAALGTSLQVTRRQVREQVSWIVYLPPYKDKADADRAIAVLRRNGITDYFLILDESPLRLGISLGVFKTEEAAAARLTALQAQRITLARIGQRNTAITKTWFRIEGIGPQTLASLEKLRASFPNQELRSCASGRGEPTQNG